MFNYSSCLSLVQWNFFNKIMYHFRNQFCSCSNDGTKKRQIFKSYFNLLYLPISRFFPSFFFRIIKVTVLHYIFWIFLKIFWYSHRYLFYNFHCEITLFQYFLAFRLKNRTWRFQKVVFYPFFTCTEALIFGKS